jgi:hypothetical protein
MRDLENEEEFIELLEKLGYIDKSHENETKVAKEFITVLNSKFSRVNLLVALCQLEKIHL